jgi:ring-1,2-phenylacetyl-CoA epoxidase subunit PaaA
MVYGTAEQRGRAQEAFETWLPRLLAYFGPPDSETYRSNPMYKFGLKVRSNDELRQQWLTKIIPVFQELGIHVDPQLASFDEVRQEWDYAAPDWVETKRIIKEGGPRYEYWRSHVASSLERNATYRDVAREAAA